MFSVYLLLLVCIYALSCHAQFPATPNDLISLTSKLDPGVKITYKQTHICEPSPGIKAYSGYVHLPAEALSGIADYSISTFFWYFEARHNSQNAPLAIYLSGGPGQPSSQAAVSSESGPCYVNPDGNSTTINQYSFNQHVNMLYIDQPVQTGFSYNHLVNGTFNQMTSGVTVSDFTNELPKQNATYKVGTFSGQDPLQTTNTSIASAKALWRFAEHWITSFPEYTTKSKQIGIWGNSYGGYWVPAVTAYFDQQIKKSSSLNSKLHSRQIATMGLTNACVDFLTQAPYYPQYAYNNTYAPLIPKNMYVGLSHNFTKAGGCRDLIQQCREIGELSDPEWTGANETVNEACTLATAYCYQYTIGGLGAVNVSMPLFLFSNIPLT
jgi:carboxypeptidase C (cathepsin A)